jgi:hypothetical protein
MWMLGSGIRWVYRVVAATPESVLKAAPAALKTQIDAA